MPFSASRTVSQSADGTSITITDTTSYTAEAKNTFSERVLNIYRADGSLFPNSAQIPFSFGSYPGDAITITGLDRDWALDVQMVLTSNAPVDGSDYTASGLVGLSTFTNLFLKEILTAVAANPSLVDNNNYYHNLQAIQTEFDNFNNAVEYGEQVSAQRALTAINHYITNKTVLF